MDLEQLITETYSAYKAEIAAEENRKKLKEELETNQAIAKLKSHLDKALSPAVQAALGIELLAGIRQRAIACFSYRGKKFYLEYGNGTEWNISIEGEDNCWRTKSLDLQGEILIELGKIRESAEPVPEMIAPEEQILNVAACLEESLDSPQIEEITASAKQLIEMIRLHFQGELKPVAKATQNQPF